MNLHPNFIEKNGKKEFAVLPYEEFVKIKSKLEDYEDLMLLRQTKEENKNEPAISLQDARKILGIK